MNSPRSTEDKVATNQDMILGEMRGQLREVVHSMNNMSAKIDGLSREVIGLGVLATEIADIKSRLIMLETSDHKREGAASIVSAILKSPALGWMFLGAVTIWAFLTGKIQT